ncbi:MAG TPA: hypothetical protein DCZ72_05490, partial [Armatimonadetes bacterium]|nr:hypothetical protein [Armatimonadota bacterium]
TGMCGGCRCLVDGGNKFACVDGPEFDGRAVDWEGLMARRRAYRPQEAATLRRLETTGRLASSGVTGGAGYPPSSDFPLVSGTIFQTKRAESTAI